MFAKLKFIYKWMYHKMKHIVANFDLHEHQIADITVPFMSVVIAQIKYDILVCD